MTSATALKFLVEPGSLELAKRDNIVINRFILKNNQITLFTCFIFIPKTDMGLPKIGNIFYFVGYNGQKKRWEMYPFKIRVCLNRAANALYGWR